MQVIDDILDVTQTTEMLGKTAAKDLAVNKTTYPKLVGLEKSKQVRLPACRVATPGRRPGRRGTRYAASTRTHMHAGTGLEAPAGRALSKTASAWSNVPWRMCAPTTHHAFCARIAPTQIADQLIEEAIQQLDGFEKSRSAPLIALAKYIGYRQN